MNGLTLQEAGRVLLKRDLSDDELAAALELWADSRAHHARQDGRPELLDGTLLLQQAARRIRLGVPA